ncbi:MAG: hopanoid-associated sugar epimerase, partial [Gammaproteobacteria bacterium]
MTTLVTGGNGFVGSAVVRALLDKGERVRALIRPGSDRRNLADLDAEIAEGDITVRESLAPAMSGCHAIFHVAADYRLWVPDPERMNRTNIDGSVHVIEAAAAARVDRVVYTSSVATLGLHGDGRPANEQTPVSIQDMIGTYKRSKYLAEAAVGRRASELGLDVVTVNPSTPVGPGDFKPTPTGKIIIDAAAGRMPAYVDTGLNVVHVDDVAAGHLLALEKGKPGEGYILGGENLSLREILALVAAHTGRNPPSVRLPHWFVIPVAYLSEAWARLAAVEP